MMYQLADPLNEERLPLGPLESLIFTCAIIKKISSFDSPYILFMIYIAKTFI